jgi:hypothetical protein
MTKSHDSKRTARGRWLRFLVALGAGAAVARRLRRGSTGDAADVPTAAKHGHTPRPADVTSPTEPLSTGEDAPSSSAMSADEPVGGTAAGDPLAGIGTPTNPVEPDGADESR